MSPRILPALLALFTASVLSSLAMASQPSGLAGEFIAEAHPPNDLCGPDISFEAYMYFGQRTLDPADTFTLEMALVPFSSGETALGFDDAIGGTFMGVLFSWNQGDLPQRQSRRPARGSSKIHPSASSERRRCR